MAMNVFEGARRIAKLLAALWVGGWVIAAFYVSPSVDVDVTYKIANPGAVPVRITEEECPPGSATKYISDKVTRSGTKTLVFLCFPSFRVSDGSRSSAEMTLDQQKALAMASARMRAAADSGDTETPSRAVPDYDLPDFVNDSPQTNTDPREELIALRRLAELENKAAGKLPQQAAPINEAEELEFRLRLAEETFVLPQSDEKWIDGQWWLLLMKEIGWGALGAIGGLLFLLAFTWTTGWIVRGFMGVPRGQDHKEKNGEMK